VLHLGRLPLCGQADGAARWEFLQAGIIFAGSIRQPIHVNQFISGARKLMENNPNVLWAEFSTLS
jgi:hypothetical protein